MIVVMREERVEMTGMVIEVREESIWMIGMTVVVGDITRMIQELTAGEQDRGIAMFMDKNIVKIMEETEVDTTNRGHQVCANFPVLLALYPYFSFPFSIMTRASKRQGGVAVCLWMMLWKLFWHVVLF